MDAKAAYYQAELQIAAGVRRLQKAWAILDDQRGNGDKNCGETCIDVSMSVMSANNALREVRRLKNEAEKQL